jgi:16S rRNA processing protein RimM
LTATPVLVGVITSAHGLDGEVRVKSFTSDPLALGNYGALSTEDGRQFGVAALRQFRADDLIVRLSGVDTRSSAEGLKGCRLYIPRAALPQPGPGEYYHADLVDLRAENIDGQEIGRVSAVLNFGAGDILEITRSDGHTQLIPFNDAHVPVVDFEGHRVVVDLTDHDAHSE